MFAGRGVLAGALARASGKVLSCYRHKLLSTQTSPPTRTPTYMEGRGSGGSSLTGT